MARKRPEGSGERVAPEAEGTRSALVLSGGGARGAYSAGVLAHLFEEIWPRLGAEARLDLVSGTSVGAIHAAYVAASAHLPPADRAARLVETWRSMRLREVMRLSLGDVLGLPARALGLGRIARRFRAGAEVLGGVVDVGPLERLVTERIPWASLRRNLRARRVGGLAVSCTEVHRGRVTVFLDGSLADTRPWLFDATSDAVCTEISVRHVRASAAIPFLFPAVRIGDRYYVDGGLRLNTPLSPALRLGADRIVVVGLKHSPGPESGESPYPEAVITQPTFLLGKVLDALFLDQLEHELRRVELVNTFLEQGRQLYGEDFAEKMNVAVREQRGVDYRPVQSAMVRPSEDLGRVAAECFRSAEGREDLGILPSLLGRFAMRGVPEGEGDLLSYLYFDRRYTGTLVDLGREDARRDEESLAALLGAA